MKISQFNLRNWLLGFFVLLVLCISWLFFAPPTVIQVATGYASKMVCSYTYLAGRDVQRSMNEDVVANGHPIMKFISVTANREQKWVRAKFLGIFAENVAVARQGTGCALAPDGELVKAKMYISNDIDGVLAPSKDAVWPQGDRVDSTIDLNVQRLVNEPALTGPGMRAVVVVRDGKIIAEKYGEGFDPNTPLLGWSMTKTVTAGLIGTLILDGKLQLDKKDLLPVWHDDERKNISLADLLSMTSGLRFKEDYGAVTDVTRMLFLEPDTAKFAAAQPLDHEPGTYFSYSSGTTALLTRIWQDSIGNEQLALEYPRRALFSPLGMRTAVLEADARGNYVGSSYLFASGRDWARYAQFLLQDGVWNGRAMLPSGYVHYMRTPSTPSMTAYGRREYGKGQVWLHGSSSGTAKGEDPDKGFSLPTDTYWFSGYDGQAIAVIPSQKLAVVRLGITPSNLGFKLQPLVQSVISSTTNPSPPSN